LGVRNADGKTSKTFPPYAHFTLKILPLKNAIFVSYYDAGSTAKVT
jgi:hypothetical protein